MKAKFRYHSSPSRDDLTDLEHRLMQTLKPVKPRPDFIRSLGQQLVTQFKVLPRLTQIGRAQVLWMALFLLMCAMVLLFVSIRAILTLISFFGLLSSYRRKGDCLPLRPRM